eukprot:GHUV01014834.1.p1 GENE.GHUV01014834.1~~GHUV01014834.1.p1  ORF type:complete len:311 (+),score=57.25 GHUV01014834.1:151-1083(+)
MRHSLLQQWKQARRFATHATPTVVLRRPYGSSIRSVTCSAALTATMQQYALVHNGQLVPCDIDSKEWLKNAPRGAYTTARTLNGDLVFMLSSHVQRLATSANLMVDADIRSNDHLSADTPLFHSDSLRPLVITCMKEATRGLKEQLAGNTHGFEAKLTLLLTWSSDGTPDLWCHAEPLLPRPNKPVKVLVKGMPRVNAKAKDSEWVRQRQTLEAAKPADVNEVILVSHDGALTEGLTSNFFVLSDQGEVVTAQEGVLDGTVRQVILQVGYQLSVFQLGGWMFRLQEHQTACAWSGITEHPRRLHGLLGWI